MINNISTYSKFMEVMKNKRFKNLDNWSAIEQQKITGKKSLNSENGEKFIEFFKKYGIAVNFSSGRFSEIYKFGDELNLKEIRIGLSHNMTLEEFIDWEYGGAENTISEIETNNDYKEYLNNLDDDDEITSFSVFLSSNFDDIEYAMSDAYNYLTKTLKNINIFSLIEPGFDVIEEIKTYSKNTQIQINNDNLEISSDIAYRLRKDSKVFYMLEDYFSNRNKTYYDFVNDIKKL